MFATIPAQEVKRRGMSVFNEPLKHGPVWVISGNRPKYVVMSMEDFRSEAHYNFVRDCKDIAAEFQAGLGERTSAKNLMEEILDGIDEET